jgi:hypothetical protein
LLRVDANDKTDEKPKENTEREVQGVLETEWPDWENFHPMCDCFLWSVMYFKITELVYIFELLYLTVTFMHSFSQKKWIGLHF